MQKKYQRLWMLTRNADCPKLPYSSIYIDLSRYSNSDVSGTTGSFSSIRTFPHLVMFPVENISLFYVSRNPDSPGTPKFGISIHSFPW